MYIFLYPLHIYSCIYIPLYNIYMCVCIYISWHLVRQKHKRTIIQAALRSPACLLGNYRTTHIYSNTYYSMTLHVDRACEQRHHPPLVFAFQDVPSSFLLVCMINQYQGAKSRPSGHSSVFWLSLAARITIWWNVPIL